MIICLTERLSWRGGRWAEEEAKLKPEYEDTYLFQMNPKAKSVLLNYKRQQKRRCNLYEFFQTHSHKHILSLKGGTPGDLHKNGADRLRGSLKKMKEINVKANSSKLRLPLLFLTFLPISLSFSHRGGMRVNSSL